jgi:hypothetical protein
MDQWHADMVINIFEMFQEMVKKYTYNLRYLILKSYKKRHFGNMKLIDNVSKLKVTSP